MSRLRLACALLILAAALPATAAADTDWKRVSNPGQSPGGPSAPRAGSRRRRGRRRVGRGDRHAQVPGVRPLHAVARRRGGGPPHRPAAEPRELGLHERDAARGAGRRRAGALHRPAEPEHGPPSGTNLTPLLPTGDVGGMFTPTSSRTADMLQAILTPAGPLWAGSSGSTLYTFREGLDPAYQITGNLIPGCCGYDPRLGLDMSGRVWLAFYSNATGAIGEWMVQLDPATGQPVPGTAQKAPLSETSDNNNGYGVGFACAAVCRIAYEETDAALGITSGRIVTWAPGETPTVVGGSPGGDVGSPTIAYRPDGRLWVAWVDRRAGRVVAKLGTGANASRGEGGVVMNAGSPPLPTTNPFLYGPRIAADRQRSAPRRQRWLRRAADRPVRQPRAGAGRHRHERRPEPPGDRRPRPAAASSIPARSRRWSSAPTAACGSSRSPTSRPASGRRSSPAARTAARLDRVSFRFTAPGAKSKCMTLQKKAAGFYKGKVLPHQVRGAHGRQREADRAERARRGARSRRSSSTRRSLPSWRPAGGPAMVGGDLRTVALQPTAYARGARGAPGARGRAGARAWRAPRGRASRGPASGRAGAGASAPARARLQDADGGDHERRADDLHGGRGDWPSTSAARSP